MVAMYGLLSVDSNIVLWSALNCGVVIWLVLPPVRSGYWQRTPDGVSKIIQIEDDHFHDHCGVFGDFRPSRSGQADLSRPLRAAASRAGIGRHRFDRRHRTSTSTKRWARCRKFSRPKCIAHLPGAAAIGHTRYSTAGDTSLINAQPIVIDCNKGKLALGHNGNLTNALELRRKLEHRGSIFQTTSDTEVIVHLMARSAARNLPGALADALNQVEGAYSLLVLTRDEMYAIRDPRGFRPLVLGRLDGAWVVGFGNLRVRSDRRGIRARSRAGRNGAHFAQRRRIDPLRAGKAASVLHFRARLFFAAGQRGLRPAGERKPRTAGPPARARASRGGRHRDAGARFGRAGGDRLRGGIRHSVSHGADPQSLRRPHVHRAASRRSATSA